MALLTTGTLRRYRGARSADAEHARVRTCLDQRVGIAAADPSYQPEIEVEQVTSDYFEDPELETATEGIIESEQEGDV